MLQNVDRDLFFNPPELGILFALVAQDGKQRCDALGIEERLYESVPSANLWLQNVVSKLHVCHTCGSPAFDRYGQEAFNKLFDLWSTMTGQGIENYLYPATVNNHYRR